MTTTQTHARLLTEASVRAGAPFLRAPETTRTIFLVTLAAAIAPLGCGMIFFGWRALYVAGLAIGGCVVLERLYYRITRMPSLLGRSHAYLTGVLLAMTLPAHVPWYVPLVAAAFAVLVGKAFFGGVGHFVWQPALVGRLAVAVLFAQQLTSPFPSYPDRQPLLAPGALLKAGDLMNAQAPERYLQWRDSETPRGVDAHLLVPPSTTLAGLSPTRSDEPQFSALMYAPTNLPGARSAALTNLPPIGDLLYGTRPGGMGETCAVVIVVAGVYLIYRNYIKWQLPVLFILSAAAVAAFAPVQLSGPDGTVLFGYGPPGGWWGQTMVHGQLTWNVLAPLDRWTLPPLLREGLDVGFIYVCYQLLSGELLLAAFFLATEMTSRPTTSGGQWIFGLGCGTLAMLLQLYVDVPIPAFMAVLVMNTFTPVIDGMLRPRVFGQRRWPWLSAILRRRPRPAVQPSARDTAESRTAR